MMKINEERFQIPVRVSREMRAWIQTNAERELRSLNAQIICVLRAAMKAEHSEKKA
jgi:hypothetical protein